MALVFLQPDIGTTIVLVAILGGMLVVAGHARRATSWRSDSRPSSRSSWPSSWA